MGRRKISLMKALTELLLLQRDDVGDNPRLRHVGGEMCDIELAISRRTEREILRILARRAKPRRFVAFVYIPRMRQAYGPRPVRGWTREQLVETCGYTEVSGKWLQGSGNVVAQPMPKGGMRLMAKCPACQQVRRKLYIGPLGVRCRKRLGLRYTSQYGYRQRRRVTAAQDRAQAQRICEATTEAMLRVDLAEAEAVMALLRMQTELLAMLHEQVPEEALAALDELRRQRDELQATLASLKAA